MPMPPEIKALDYRVSGAGTHHQVAKESSAVSTLFMLLSCTTGNLLTICQVYQVKLSKQGIVVQVLNSALVHIYIHRKKGLPNKRVGVYPTVWVESLGSLRGPHTQSVNLSTVYQMSTCNSQHTHKNYKIVL